MVCCCFGFPGGGGKNLPANTGDARDVVYFPGSGRPFGIRKRQLLPVFLPGKFQHGQRSLVCYRPWGPELYLTEPTTTPTHIHRHIAMLLLFFPFFWLCCVAWDLGSQLVLNPCTLHWMSGVLATEPQEILHAFFFSLRTSFSFGYFWTDKLFWLSCLLERKDFGLYVRREGKPHKEDSLIIFLVLKDYKKFQG